MKKRRKICGFAIFLTQNLNYYETDKTFDPKENPF